MCPIACPPPSSRGLSAGSRKTLNRSLCHWIPRTSRGTTVVSEYRERLHQSRSGCQLKACWHDRVLDFLHHLFRLLLCFFFFNDTATTEIYTLSLHDALPILSAGSRKTL